MSTPEHPTESSELLAFGERLKQGRLQQGLDLDGLATRLCMRKEQIIALESGDRSLWPERVLAIAQVRRLAEALGLDATDLIANLRQSLDQIPPEAPSSAALAVMGASSKHGQKIPDREEGTKNWLAVSTKQKRTNGLNIFAWLFPIALLIGLGTFGFHELAKLQKTTITSPAPSTKPTLKTKKAVISGLRLVSKQKAWLAVRRLQDKKIIFEGNFQGSRIFNLANGLEVRSGRPDLVQVQSADGSFKKLGRIDLIEWVKFMPTAIVDPGNQPQP